jgi:hypothetical protein
MKSLNKEIDTIAAQLSTIKPIKPQPSAWLEVYHLVLRLGVISLMMFFSRFSLRLKA